MPGINLAQGAQQEEARKTERRSKRGTAVVLLGLVLVFGVWGSLVWYEKMVSDDIRVVNGQIESVRQSVSGAELDRVADFHFRLETIGDRIDKTGDPLAILKMIESGVEPDVVLSGILYDESDGVVVSGETKEFQAIVRQMVAFKGASSVSSASLRDLKRTEGGDFEFSVFVAMSGGDGV